MKVSIILIILLSSVLNLFAQNVGIGTAIPNANALLHVDLGLSNSKGVLFSGSFNSVSTVPDLGAGSRLIYFPGKAAFRVGRITGTEWDNANVGRSSVAMNFNSMAVGDYSTALGWGTTASGTSSLATGENTIASGSNCFTTGLQTTASNVRSVAMGFSTTASGQTSTAMGYQTISSGWNATSMGFNTIARGANSTVVGMYNEPILASSQSASTSTTPLFIVGNGVDESNRSNAMVVRKDGRIGVGTNSPASTLHVYQSGATPGIILENAVDGNRWRIYSASGDNNLTFYNNANTEIADIDDVTGTFSALSDSRFKKDIEPMQAVLPLLLKLQPKYYHFNWQSSSTKKELGMLAQEARELFPELVSYDEEKDLYKMNYAGFSTVAIKAIQEQQAVIQKQQNTIDDLIKRIESLEKR